MATNSNQFKLKPPEVANILIVCSPFVRFATPEIVVQFCHPLVEFIVLEKSVLPFD
jgi:hypothetical protein